jgi:hypothetical protein
MSQKPSPPPEYTWQKERLKSDRLPGAAMSGQIYGPGGEYSLFLPPAHSHRTIQFIGGKPNTVSVASCFDIPEIAAARESVLRSTNLRGIKRIEDFLLAAQAIRYRRSRYSALLLATQYHLSDEDLTMLHKGDHWQMPLVRHALGGDKAVNVWRGIPATVIGQISLDAEQRLTAAILARDSVSLIAADPVETAVAQIVAQGELVDNLDLDMD